MILSIGEVRDLCQADIPDCEIKSLVDGLESTIISYTNNKFINRTTGTTEYPPAIKLGVINLLKWEFANRDKIGITSETISRHSVNYKGLATDDTICGYPSYLMSFLKPYMRARF